ncbi:SCO0930 family lipoprotein [Streptomyces sp. NPDC051784]|uniref:SCO0930 family lipoprotein n=1 Tax=Streptomyces sp. NPDC051784 TaxID=3155805 RepID=UPI0034145984
METWRNASLAVTAAALLALTACGQGEGDASPRGLAVGNAASAEGGYGSDGGYGAGSADAGAGASKPAGQLAVWDSGELGKVLTDSEGFTLYRFDKDSTEPPKSNCDGDCAKAWPPVPAEEATAAAGTGADAIGQVIRPDGSRQLTVGGRPVYRYAEDSSPGEAKGQGVGGTWFAAAPDGKKATPEADGSADASRAGISGLSVRQDPELGEIVVDKRGMTVYRFKKDSAWPMKSACTGACLKKWPVVAPVSRNDVEGVTTKGFVTFDRPDGIRQQSIDCWPVYTFSGDEKPGDTNGQGVGGTWYAVTPDAKLAGSPK